MTRTTMMTTTTMTTMEKRLDAGKREREKEAGRRADERSRREAKGKGEGTNDDKEGKSPPAVLVCYCGTRESCKSCRGGGGAPESLRRSRRLYSPSREGRRAERDGAPTRLQDKEPRSAVVLVHKRYQAHLHISV